MSQISDRKRYVKNLWILWLISAIIKNITNFEIVERLIIVSTFEKQRYIESKRMFINKFNWISIILFIYSKTRFRIWIKINKYTFEKMIEIFNNDFIFHNESTCEQISLNEQLHLILFKFDNANEKVNFVKFAITWSVLKNHVYNCIRRIILILFNLKKRYIICSNEKKNMKAWKMTIVSTLLIV